MSDFSWAALSTAQRWQWHAEVYALRRVMFGVDRGERTSPCDPKGKWFDEPLVDAAENKLRQRIAKRSQFDPTQISPERADDIRRAIERAAYLNSSENGERLSKIKRELDGYRSRGTLQHAATALGVKAREYTAEELRAGRIALSLEKPPRAAE